MAMRAFPQQMDAIDDLKVCLVKNRTARPFICSDDPAVLTNRWSLEDKRVGAFSSGLHSAGAVFFLPISPRILCIAYDGDVYSIPHKNGWAETNRELDIVAFNEHQFLNAWSSVYFSASNDGPWILEAYRNAAPRRPKSRYELHYAVLDRVEGSAKRYRVVDFPNAVEHEEAIIHTQVIRAKPSAWPFLVKKRSNGCVYTNGTGAGYLRIAHSYKLSSPPFWRAPAWS